MCKDLIHRTTSNCEEGKVKHPKGKGNETQRMRHRISPTGQHALVIHCFLRAGKNRDFTRGRSIVETGGGLVKRGLIMIQRFNLMGETGVSGLYLTFQIKGGNRSARINI